jgi:hypothetical protein
MPAVSTPGVSFDPDALRVLFRVFDEVWAELAPSTLIAMHGATRNVIASAIMQAAIDGEQGPERLRLVARSRGRAMSLGYWKSEWLGIPAGP